MTGSIMRISDVPAMIWGERVGRVFLYIHGQGGRREEGERLAKIVCPRGWQTLAVDLPGHGARDRSEELTPWRAVSELRRVMNYMQERWHTFGLCAADIGAWLSMQAYADIAFEKCLFVSPITDMKAILSLRMSAMSVTETQLRQAGRVTAVWGETISWREWQYACQHPILAWPHPASILCAAEDHAVGRTSIDAFAAAIGARQTVCPFGEHQFRTPEQLEALDRWLDEETA